MLCYCKKCGGIVSRLSKNIESPCNYCQSKIFVVPKQYTLKELETCLDKDLKEQFINEYIKSSPEFDQYLFEHREEDMFNKRMSDQAKMEHGKQILENASRVPKCPTCQSTNIRKISRLESGASIAMFGLFSRKINKTFKCQSCGYTW